MGANRFEDMKSIDGRIRQAMLDDNKGQPPDNFIEDSQGGGLDADLLAAESPTEEQALVRGLKRQLHDAHPDADIAE